MENPLRRKKEAVENKVLKRREMLVEIVYSYKEEEEKINLFCIGCLLGLLELRWCGI